MMHSAWASLYAVGRVASHSSLVVVFDTFPHRVNVGVEQVSGCWESGVFASPTKPTSISPL